MIVSNTVGGSGLEFESLTQELDNDTFIFAVTCHKRRLKHLHSSAMQILCGAHCSLTLLLFARNRAWGEPNSTTATYAGKPVLSVGFVCASFCFTLALIAVSLPRKMPDASSRADR